MALLPTACNQGDGPIAPEKPSTPASSVAIVAGTVTSSTSGKPVAGANVRIGATTVTTGADGHYELKGLAIGPATLRCLAPQFEDFETNVTVPSDGLQHDISLTPAPLRVMGGVDALAQVFIQVDRKGRAVTDAVVTVNGVAIPYAGRDAYKGALPGVIPAGSPVHLKVSSDGVTVEATGAVPETPVLTAPAAGSAFEFPDTLSLTWTSTTDPDLFIGSMGETAGNAREARIRVRSIACDCDGLTSDVSKTIGISAVRRLTSGRDFEGRVAVSSNFTIESARSQAVITVKPASLSLPLYVAADLGPHNLVGPWVASVYVGDSSFHEIPAAVVSVNGTAMPRFCPFGCVFGGSLPDFPIGSSLVLDVEAGKTRVTGISVRPETPVLTAPTGGATYTLADSITVTWSSQTNPDGFVLRASSDGAGAFVADLGLVSGTSRERTFAARDLGDHAAGPWRISVQAQNQGTLTGPLRSESYMHVRSGKAEITIVIGP